MAKDTTPSPRASIRARMGSAVRRTSSIFGTPKPSGSSAKSVHSNDSSSAKNVDAPAPIVVSTENLHEHLQHQSHMPSPIAESPAREAAALSAQTPVVGPSPLVQSVLHDEPVSIGSMAPSLNENEDAPPAAPVQEEAQVTETTNEEVGVGAGAVSNEELRPAPSSDKVSIATQADEPEPEPEVKDVPTAVATQAELKVQEQAPSAEESLIDSPPPPPAPGTMAAASSYFEDRSADAPSTPIRAVPTAPSVHEEEDDDLSVVWGRHAPNGVPTADEEDPFADPVQTRDVASIKTPEQAPAALSIRVTSSQQSDRTPSPAQSVRILPIQTDERQPLLSRPVQSYLEAGSTNPTRVNVSPMSAPAVVLWPTSPPPASPRLHELGWIEFFLPDNTGYYVHPTRRATTDIDLRNSSKLDVVTSYFERYKDGGPSGLELYLCERKSKRRDTALVEWWVDSAKRIISSKVHNVEGETQLLIDGKDDVLDMEYRYWTFIESHPAHCAVANAARLEAMDILTWSWTDQILPARTGIRTPFTQAECQELMNLLRSFEGNQTQALLHNRVIARIFLRLLEWRQATYRPDKPLPASFARSKRNPLRTSFLQRLFRIIVGGACLGVPFLFATRMRHRMDIESGVHKVGSMFLLCAGTCLVAAVVLSASVTFLSLPGLDNIARIAGLVSVLLAAFSIASTVPAIFRYKADVERASAMLNSEGLIFISRRNVVFSLPIVFLLYAIVGFVTAVVLYSFRGAPTQQPFSDYTSWIVVGVVGACLGVLTTSVLIMTR